MNRRDLILGGLGLALSSAAYAQTDRKRYAIILANQTYVSNPLPNILNDAKLMDVTLRRIGFATTLVLDKNRSGMLDAIRMFRTKLTPGSIVLVYYSGHGAQVDGENYLVPIDDSKIDDSEALKDNCISLSSVMDKIGRTEGQLNLVILDACRDNPFAGTKSQTRGLAGVSSPASGDYFAMAASPGQTASANPRGKNSLYTQELVQRLAAPGLRLEDVFIETRNAVVKASAGKQVPQEFGSLTSKVYLASNASALVDVEPTVEQPTSARLELLGVAANARIMVYGTVLSGTVYTDNLSEPTREVQVSVTADGYRPYSSKVTLFRGTSTQLKVDLERIAPVASTGEFSAALQPLRDAVAAAERLYRSDPRNRDYVKAYSRALGEYGHAQMTDQSVTPRLRYPQALNTLRKAVDVDPSNKQAAVDKKAIEDAFRSMGRPIPNL
jgi:tetratricopeptide (TPR) repeat protein